MTRRSAGARGRILADLRAARVRDPGRPRFEATAPEGVDLLAAFGEALRAAGGELIAVAEERAGEAVRALPGITEGARWFSDLPEVASPTGPHALRHLDLALLGGHLGVAESGAVWIEPRSVRARAAAFLAAEVVLVLPAHAIVADLHAAYERIAFDGPGFGCFVAGPSKTADIEQSLVIGAHGPRALRVLALGAGGEGA